MPFPTDVDVCNLALSRIGLWQITDIMLDSEIERHCRLHLPQARRSLLRRHAWNFAIACPALVASPSAGFGDMKRFTLPTDYLQALAVYEDIDRSCRIDAFKIERQSIFVQADTAFLEYVADMPDPIAWTADFLDCVVLKLAARLCVPLGASNNRSQELIQELEQIAFPEATLNNAWEDSSGENNPTAERIANSEYVRASQFYI
jgi:hypothetical protein